MNKKIKLLLLICLLVSCKNGDKYTGDWIALEEPFLGMSMTIKSNGSVFFIDIPMVKPNIIADLESNTLGLSERLIFDATEKEGLFDATTLSISFENGEHVEKSRVMFSDGKRLELLLENGYVIVFDKKN